MKGESVIGEDMLLNKNQIPKGYSKEAMEKDRAVMLNSVQAKLAKDPNGVLYRTKKKNRSGAGAKRTGGGFNPKNNPY